MSPLILKKLHLTSLILKSPSDSFKIKQLKKSAQPLYLQNSVNSLPYLIHFSIARKPQILITIHSSMSLIVAAVI